MALATILIILLVLSGVGLVSLGAPGLLKRFSGRDATLVLAGTIFLIIGVNTSAALPLVGPILQHGAYRDHNCSGQALRAWRAVDPTTGEEDRSSARCDVQLVLNDGLPIGGSASPDGGQCWHAIDPSSSNAATCYSLGVLEYGDNGKLLAKNQMRDLHRHLAQLRDALAAPTDVGASEERPSVYMIAYVHGWRHDARYGDSNLRRFRGLIAAAARDVAARCAIAQHHCRTAVVGAYVSWRGSVGVWDRDADAETLTAVDKLAVGLNGLTFPGRKVVSDRLGPPVMQQIAELRHEADAIFDGRVRMLLIGHSLGGNLVLSGITPPAGEERLGLPADLTVLINPATEAAKWEDLWDKVHRQTWSAATPPRLISIVSPPRYYESASPQTVDAHGRPLRSAAQEKRLSEIWRKSASSYDTVVDGAFRFSQMASVFPGRGCSYDRLVYGLSHLLYGTTSCRDEHLKRYSSHFLEVNPSSNSRASTLDYAASRDGRESCFIEPAFLQCARARGNWSAERCDVMRKDIGKRGSWDFRSLTEKTLGRTRNRFIATGESLLGVTGDPSQAQCFTQKAGLPTRLLSQWQQESAQLGTGWHSGEGGHAAEDFNPMWGVRALPISLRGHSGFWTAPVACLFNKLVLDDPMAIEHPNERDPDAFSRPIGQKEFVATLLPKCAVLYRSRS